MSTKIYRVRLATADETLARKYGEHFYTGLDGFRAANEKCEELIKAMTDECRFIHRGVKGVHQENAPVIKTDTQIVRRHRLAATATCLENGHKAQCEYLVCTPWVEFTFITTEE